MPGKEVIGALDLVLNGQIPDRGVAQGGADRDQDIGQRFRFGDDRFDPVQGEDRFLGGNPDDRFEEIVLDAAIADLGGERGFPHAADPLDPDDERPAVGLQGLQNGADLLLPSRRNKGAAAGLPAQLDFSVSLVVVVKLSICLL